MSIEYLLTNLQNISILMDMIPLLDLLSLYSTNIGKVVWRNP